MKVTSIMTAYLCNPKTKDIHVSSVEGKQDSYIVSFDHDGRYNDIFARIYCRDNTWYIWYEKLHYRYSVKDFTTAILKVEEELLSCVA